MLNTAMRDRLYKAGFNDRQIRTLENYCAWFAGDDGLTRERETLFVDGGLKAEKVKAAYCAKAGISLEDYLPEQQAREQRWIGFVAGSVDLFARVMRNEARNMPRREADRETVIEIGSALVRGIMERKAKSRLLAAWDRAKAGKCEGIALQ